VAAQRRVVDRQHAGRAGGKSDGAVAGSAERSKVQRTAPATPPRRLRPGVPDVSESARSHLRREAVGGDFRGPTMG
jgi:hypothetical protein